MMKWAIGLLLCLFWVSCQRNDRNPQTHFIDASKVSFRYFGQDRDWYQKDIPFFACSDTTIQNVYYYRWKLYKAHLRNLGADGYIVTEFLNAMSWDRKPYSSLNDAASYHIYEGRWLKDRRYMHDYIDYMYQHGGNDRHFSEAIADAAYADYLIYPDSAWITSELPFMIELYRAWRDHYDSSKGLYYIEPLLDATEYTIASIDASGGKDGFTGGDAFRPSINSYMYANARAISEIALLKKDSLIAKTFNASASEIKTRLQSGLWNDSLVDFVDRYQLTNQYVQYWHFIRGRELVGYEPWAFNLPDDRPRFNAAWRHVMDTSELMGRYGLRTVEPSYPYYMRQYRYDKATGQRECQWNGPSWPFQTCMVLRGMANLLNHYHQQQITKDDYLFVLEQYARQHYQQGHLDLVEDYDPDKGGPIVDIDQRSEHYNHSEFNDLVITGLCGIRPAAGDSLVINPLVSTDSLAPVSIRYFCLENVAYHGHELTVLYDKDGHKYHQGKGLQVYLDGRRVMGPVPLGRKVIRIPEVAIKPVVSEPVDISVNLSGKGFPRASASYRDSLNGPYKALDGRVWYFKNVRNRWSSYGSGHATDWFEVTFKKPVRIDSIGLFLYGDGKRFSAPAAYRLEYWAGNKWTAPSGVKKSPATPIADTRNIISFKTIRASKVRVYFTHAGSGKYTALAELEAYGGPAHRGR